MFDSYKKFFFIGIGGIGMSALAKFFLKKGKLIFGYDNNKSEICVSLERLGAKISYEDSNLDFILDNNIFKHQKNCLIVYTPAINLNNVYLKFFNKNNFTVKKRSEILSKICENKFLIAIAGTHGKTTTTCIISHILNNSKLDITAFVGGISKNLNSNLIGGNGRNEILIVEADEYDKSFLHLTPNIAVITSLDMDHSDIYKNLKSLKKAFKQFIQNISKNGVLIIEKEALEKLGKINFSNIITYSFSDESHFSISSYKLKNRKSSFNFSNKHNKDSFLKNEIETSLPGKHNILNFLASIIVCNHLDIKKEVIINSINSFLGIKRRFEIHFQSEEKVYVDDYAHHPVEIKKTLETIKDLYPKRKVTLIFQPHLFTRTRDFMQEFANVLSYPNHLILLDIFPAREVPIKGVDSSILLKKCSNKNKHFSTEKNIFRILNKYHFDILVTMGAGSISNLVEPIKMKYFA